MTDTATVTHYPLLAYAVQSHARGLLLYLSAHTAHLYAAERGLSVIHLEEQTSPNQIVLAWGVRHGANLALYTDPAAAERAAVLLHGTVHPLAEPQRAEDSTPMRRAAARDLQGELTPGGLMRL